MIPCPIFNLRLLLDSLVNYVSFLTEHRECYFVRKYEKHNTEMILGHECP